jgi:hypothetical protein
MQLQKSTSGRSGDWRRSIACDAAAMLSCLLCWPASAAQAPSSASEVGYTQNTFSANFSSSNVDISNSRNPGYTWYLWNLYNSHASPAAIGINSDGSVTLAGDTVGPGGELMTATPAKNSAGFVGTAFGGGAYIEATFKFDPADVDRAHSKTWPAFWSLALESIGVRPGANQWSGQAPGYQHQIEVDFFEYLLLAYGGPQNAYASSMHDWYGIYKSTCPPGLCQVGFEFNESKRLAPTGTDFTQYHTYGSLWVPATSGTPGYIQFFFDGEPIGGVRKWAQFTDQPPTNPKQQPWAFGVLDRQHLILILGTGPQEPMTVQSVNVWQASASQNLHN